MGTTDKKNRITRDDKETTGSVDNGSGNGSTDASASLAARRAKLRGALGGAKTGGPMPDPFSSGPAPYPTDEYGNPSDPYGSQQSQYPNDPYANQQNQYPQSDPFGTQTDPYSSQEETPYPQPDIDEALDAYMQQAQQSEFPTHPESPAPEEYSQEQEVNVYGVPIEEASADILPATTPEPRVSRSRRSSNTASTPIPAAASASFEAVPSMPSATKSSSIQPLPPVSDKTVELVNSIDQSLNICATNLAALQNLAGEQTEVLKGLSQTLQNQTLLEIGLNLNSLTESLTAALEPMKSIGELVPALDSLVSALEGKEQDQSEKLSPDQLVTSLADQLSAGLIDPWTFKCAYMAVYPADHPADLLHRLVELLGTQRLSGDLFRAAYEAVQAAEPPPGRTVYAPPSGEARAGIVDENIKAQLDNLERANRELQKRQDERERELNEVLAQKDQELQSAQEQLNQRFEELNGRYADAADMIAAREEEFRAALESKDMDIIEKDAELNMLRAQMEELREQTESMVKDLQREMLRLKENQETMASSGGGSESNSSSGANSQNFFESGPQTPKPGGLFESGSGNKPVFAPEPASGGFADTNFSAAENSSNFGGESGGFAAAQNPQASFQAAQAAAFNAPSFQPPPNPTFQPPQPATPAQQSVPQPNSRPASPATGPGPSPPTTPFGGQSGSYGMGVRQQVFEVIVRQALAGAPWREICAGPMQVNNISPDEVEAEVKRRQSMLNK